MPDVPTSQCECKAHTEPIYILTADYDDGSHVHRFDGYVCDVHDDCCETSGRLGHHDPACRHHDADCSVCRSAVPADDYNADPAHFNRAAFGSPNDGSGLL